MLSIATDYARDTGCPQRDLERIAAAGFTHIHWCHQWNTDFVYMPSEIVQIARWLHDCGLRLNDLHASDGVEKRWYAPQAYAREAGVELVRNRLRMTAELGADVIVMHMGDVPGPPAHAQAYWDALFQSLDDLAPDAAACGVRIAIENGVFAHLRRVLERYPADYVGLCYDAGHGNLSGDGLRELDALKHRLIAVHLHDNDGHTDQHKPLFSGTIDWPRLAALLAASSYAKPLNMEVGIRNSGIADETVFLERAFQEGARLASLIAAARD